MFISDRPYHSRILSLILCTLDTSNTDLLYSTSNCNELLRDSISVNTVKTHNY